MKNKNPIGLCAAGLLLAGSLGFVGEAHANFTVRIDCRGDGGLPTWSATRDTITVYAMILGWWVKVGSKVMDDCSTENSQLISYSGPAYAHDVSRLIISTNGTNNFWIDEFALLNQAGDKFDSWGVDNDVGYCLSKNFAEGNTPYCWQERAVEYINADVDP